MPKFLTRLTRAAHPAAESTNFRVLRMISLQPLHQILSPVGLSGSSIGKGQDVSVPKRTKLTLEYPFYTGKTPLPNSVHRAFRCTSSLA